MHLTNYSVNKHSEKFVKNCDSKQSGEGGSSLSQIALPATDSDCEGGDSCDAGDADEGSAAS